MAGRKAGQREDGEAGHWLLRRSGGLLLRGPLHAPAHLPGQLCRAGDGQRPHPESGGRCAAHCHLHDLHDLRVPDEGHPAGVRLPRRGAQDHLLLREAAGADGGERPGPVQAPPPLRNQLPPGGDYRGHPDQHSGFRPLSGGQRGAADARPAAAAAPGGGHHLRVQSLRGRP